MQTTRLLAHLLPLALLTFANPAHAAPRRLAVAALDAPPELTFMGKSLAAAIADEAKAAGFQVMGPEAVEAKLGRAATLKLVGCADDAKCLAEQAGALGVDGVVGGWLQKDGEHYKVGLVHADVASRVRLAFAQREVPIASRRLKQEVVSATGPLLSGKAEAKAGAKVEAKGAPDMPSGRGAK